MKQLIQNFKTGDLYVDEVPLPSLSEGMVLIETEYSLISAGTERNTVKVAQSNLIGKARKRPDLVAQVLQNIRKEGLKATLAKVRTKLDSLKALGYSCSGRVIASMDTEGKFKPGDLVACAGQDYASHAEIVSVPQNLVVKVPDGVGADEAAFTTFGAIALQGVRQANPKLGENVAVIGLGLLGQITCQLLQANGCRVMGIDLNPGLIAMSLQSGVNSAVNRKDPNLVKACENFTRGFGFDSVIITAAAPTNDPIELAAEISRKKGSVIIVGAVKMDIPREPHFYRKELELKMSCSYGPGRYDVEFEENGHDYPYAYVRWTEQRNMEAFLDMLAAKRFSMKHLISHVFPIDEAGKAYDIITGKDPQPHTGILLRYEPRESKFISEVPVKSTGTASVTVGFVGAGSFAQSYLIPNVKSLGVLKAVATSRGITAKNVADKFGFGSCSSEANDIFNHPEINTVFIATPHNSHAGFTAKALNAGKHVFVEKPLAITQEQLEEVRNAASHTNQLVMVGFNRRFAPVSRAIKKAFEGAGEPLVMQFRVNAGFIPREHWTQQTHIGGGRILGEVCHFIDLMQYFTGADPVQVYAETLSADNSRILTEDNVAIVVKFSDGSVGNLTYIANGDKAMAKESLEIFGAGKCAVINDFRDGTLYAHGKSTALKLSGKGHKEEVEAFIQAVKTGGPSPISFHSILMTTLTTLKILDSIRTGQSQQISIDA